MKLTGGIHELPRPKRGAYDRVARPGRHRALQLNRLRAMDDRMLISGPDKQVPPKSRRGTLVVPGEGQWMIEC